MYPDGCIGSDPAPTATGEKRRTSIKHVARQRARER
jgi:hypothetical protein